jgi:hypothetical protein
MSEFPGSFVVNGGAWTMAKQDEETYAEAVVTETAKASGATPEEVVTAIEEEVQRVAHFLTSMRADEPEAVAAVLRRLAEWGRELGAVKAKHRRVRRSAADKERARKKREAVAVEKRRLEAELRAARSLLNRIDYVEALAKRLEAAEGSVMRNARTVMEDANTILRNADGLVARIAELNEVVDMKERVELATRLRRAGATPPAIPAGAGRNGS